MSKLTDLELHSIYSKAFSEKSSEGIVTACVAALRAIESAATEPLLQRIAELEAKEKALLAQVQGHTKWREKIVKASEQAYGESAIRYKFSLTKSGKVMNTFPKEIDGRWFALVPAEDDGHIGHIARIAELERQLEEARKDAERYRWLRSDDIEVPHGQREICVLLMRLPFREDQTDELLIESELDAAIDAAMQKGQA